MADQDKDQKTEEATPRRKNEARSRGQVAQSQKFIAACMMLATIGTFLVLGPRLAGSIGMMVPDAASRASSLARADLSPRQFAGLLVESGSGVAVSLAVFAAPVLLVGFLVCYGQVGFKLTPKALEVKVDKLNPISGFKKILGPRGFMRTGLGVLEIAAIGGTVAFVTWSGLSELVLAAGTDAGTTAVAMGRAVFRAATAAAVVFLAISLIDFIYQRRQHAKDLRMSKQEVKDEAKNSEGDPQVKARIRQVQRETAARRMMADVPDADAVVMNPTHYAVAIKYDHGSDAPPRVVAKGLDHVALRIRDVAEEAGVVVVEEPPLARALHRACEIGDPVPEDLFEAVAKLLAYVYRLKGQAVDSGSPASPSGAEARSPQAVA